MKKIFIVISILFFAILTAFLIKFKFTNENITTSKTENTTNFLEEAEKNAESIEKQKASRKEIENYGKSIYQSIVLIQDTTNSKNWGTGFIVGNNKILTNRHVTNHDNEMIVRLANKNNEFTDFKIKSVTNAPNDADLSIIEVYPNENGQNIDDNVNILELATKDEIDNTKIGDKVYTIGFPEDKDYGTLWESKGKITSLGGNFINYDAFIVGGNSGSPLFNENNKIIGISNASDSESTDKVISFGFLLNEELYNFIEKNI